MTEIVVLVPVFRRPDHVQPLLDSFNASKPDSAHVLFIASPDDKQERAALEDVEHLVMPESRKRGDWAAKINYGYKHTSEPWILCGADDIRFHQGWDEALLKAAAKTHKRVLGTNDLNPHSDGRGVYSPHPLVARSYADECGTMDGPGQIFCELYDHNYPDRELADTAIARGEWLFVRRAVIEHMHPGWHDVRRDKTYRLGARETVRDSLLYQRRIKLMNDRTMHPKRWR